VPLAFHEEGLDQRLVDKLNMWTAAPNLDSWRRTVQTARGAEKSVEIAVVGKYVDLTDSYKSLNEALAHGGIANECKTDPRFIDSEKIEQDGLPDDLDQVDAILVPMGFGPRGAEGKIEAVRFARENKIPFFGICFGMQMAVIEYARHVAGLEGANSVEVDERSPHPVIHLMEDQHRVTEKGGTMRLGSYPCVLGSKTRAAEIYGCEKIDERHRHRFEVNNRYRDQLEAAGLVLSGLSPDGNLVELVEIPDHPWFMACQFHPEFKSRPNRCHPLFRGFVRAALQRRIEREKAPRLSAVK
jgi:CTP synthase